MPRWVVIVIVCLIVVLLFPLLANLPSEKETATFAGSPIHMAAKNRGIDVINNAIESGANSKVEFGKTPLHYAAENGYVSGVRLLLENGADANILRTQGITALQLAKANNHGGTTGALKKGTSNEIVMLNRSTLPLIRRPR